MGFSREGSARSSSFTVFHCLIHHKKAVQGFPAMQVIAFCCLVLNSQDQAGQLLLGQRETEGKKDWRQRGEPCKAGTDAEGMREVVFQERAEILEQQLMSNIAYPLLHRCKSHPGSSGIWYSQSRHVCSNFSSSPLSSKAS